MRKSWNRPYLNLPPADYQEIVELLPILGMRSVSEFVRRAVLDELRRLEAEQRKLTAGPTGTIRERQRLAVLGFVRDGHRTLEDIRSVCQVLMPLEIESILFGLEQEDMLDRRDAKRGCAWQWELTPTGEAFLQAKSLA